MKRWIHATTDSNGWKRQFNYELGYGYDIKEDGNIRAISRQFDNDGEWGYTVSVYVDGDLSAEETFMYEGSRQKAIEWADSIMNSTDVTASWDPTVADEYVVKIWYETDSPRGGLPSAAEEVFFTVANSPSAAIEQVKREWTGPIDRIEIVDVNPEDMDEDDYMEIPFNSSTNVNAAVNSFGGGARGKDGQSDLIKKWYTADMYNEADPDRLQSIKEIDWDIVAEDVEEFLLDEDIWPDLDHIAAVKYFNEADQEWAEANGYEGGYEVEYDDGSIKKFAWEFGNSPVDEVEI